MVKIYLDPGHGGSDSGAVGNGLYEKNLNLSIIKKIQKKLEENYKNVEIMLTRMDDVFLSLTARTDKANNWGADYFLSVHINASTSVASKGFETHIYKYPSDKEIAFQNIMHEEIFKQINTKAVDRGKLKSNFHVLRESKMASILTENLFVSNSGDASLLKQDAFLEKLATGHVLGLEKSLGLQLKEVATSPTLPTEEPMYQIICGTFAVLENAEKQIEKLTADGYKAYIFKKQ